MTAARRWPLYKRAARAECVFTFNIPSHVNLGDQAIAVAEARYLESILPAQVARAEITDREYLAPGFQRRFSRIVSSDALLLFHGGGNLGTLWFEHERALREMIRLYPRNRIIALPQSVCYEDSACGKAQLAEARRIYSAHPDLHLCARDYISHDFMRQAFPANHVYLMPDMVMSMKGQTGDTVREGILICLRGDRERALTDAQREQIRALCAGLGKATRTTDTVLPPLEAKGLVLPRDREAALKKKLDEFRGANLVVTDRLHGMIFCALAGTPCIVLNNANHKIQGAYDWLKHLPYIRLMPSLDGLEQEMRRLLEAGPGVYDNQRLIPAFQPLQAAILNPFKGAFAADN